MLISRERLFCYNPLLLAPSCRFQFVQGDATTPRHLPADGRNLSSWLHLSPTAPLLGASGTSVFSWLMGCYPALWKRPSCRVLSAVLLALHKGCWERQQSVALGQCNDASSVKVESYKLQNLRCIEPVQTPGSLWNPASI